ncbi:ABC transporter ATP-binding protein [Paenibacillus oceani]|uniref:ABC transporter ATP-binding protein n=1 Tax=Paenibacillus oceani TaxID=2772510 RepID=A0A927CCL4_9BACL|nr:ABC transporter ATP-binding protein [Paenibacillus oceani]MBD2865588.1 ABC transporter ATP-binding protein [Paenibacillus oceani]
MNIQIKNLSKKYGNHHALSQLNLSIGSGMFGLLGPNGTGKTTLMKILATLQAPSSGEVRFGELLLGKDDHEIRKVVGYLPQHFGLYERLTGEEFLDYIAILKGIRHPVHRKKQIDAVLEEVNLADKRKFKIRTYSGGMRQRVGIAQALLGNPQIIITDEPTVGLDPEERIRFRNMLGELSVDRIVLLSTHIVGDIETSCTELAIMHAGNVLFQGQPETLLDRMEGKVWTTIVNKQESAEIRSKKNFLSQRTVQNGYELRVLSDETPIGQAVLASPNLEDAYMALIGGHSIE